MGVEEKMNNKVLADIRKQFKLDNQRMQITEILNIYVQKETGNIYHYSGHPFPLLERETQELFLANFKKVLSGKSDEKIFDLKFRHNHSDKDNTQAILYKSLKMPANEWQENMLKIVNKMFAGGSYEFDVVVTFIRGEYVKPQQKRDAESEEGGMDEAYSNPFILCSTNKMDQPKKALLFDYIEKEIRPTNGLDPIINLTSPLYGFLFPVIYDYGFDVNRILYYTGKANQPDEQFIDEILQCEKIVTALEEKDSFSYILQSVIGDKVESDVIANVYAEIGKLALTQEDEEESEPPTVDQKDIERILKASGIEKVDSHKLETAFQDIMLDEKHEFKATNVVPKKIKIQTKVANVSIDPKDFKYVKYITYQGKRCLLLEIDEDVIVEGFRLETGNL